MDIIDFFGKKTTVKKDYSSSLSDKYCILHSKDFLDNKLECSNIKKWLLEKKTKNALILYGPVGSGKSKLIELICNECDIRMIYINSTMKRGKKELNDLYEKNYSSKNKVFVIDEMESFCNNEHISVQTFVPWIDKKKNKKGFNIPFIFIINSTYISKLNDIKQHCVQIKIQYPKTKSIFSKCIDIIDKENIDLDLDLLRDYILKFNNDFRFIVNNLNNIDMSTFIDCDMEMYEIFKFMSSNKNIDDKLRQFLKESGTLPIIFQENYIKWDLEDHQLLEISKLLHEGDIFHQSQYKKEFESNFNSYLYSIYSIIYPFSLLYDNEINHSLTTFGSIWTKQSCKYQKRKYINSVKFCTGLYNVECLSILNEIYTSNIDNEDISSFYDLDDQHKKDIVKMFSCS